MQKCLITKWQEMIVKGILDGKTKRNSVAYQKMAEALMERFELECSITTLKASLKNKLKYLRDRFYKADKFNTSGKGRDDILKICPLYYELLPILKDRPLTRPPVVVDSGARQQRDPTPASDQSNEDPNTGDPEATEDSHGPVDPEAYEHENVLEAYEEELQRVRTPDGFPGHINGPDDPEQDSQDSDVEMLVLEDEVLAPAAQAPQAQQVAPRAPAARRLGPIPAAHENARDAARNGGAPPKKKTKFETSMDLYQERQTRADVAAEERMFQRQETLQNRYFRWEEQRHAEDLEERRMLAEQQTRYQNNLLHLLGNLIQQPAQLNQPAHSSPQLFQQQTPHAPHSVSMPVTPATPRHSYPQTPPPPSTSRSSGNSSSFVDMDTGRFTSWE